MKTISFILTGYFNGVCCDLRTILQETSWSNLNKKRPQVQSEKIIIRSGVWME